MIETHDQHKPGNLANSAVLKMLEEEESERIYPVNERKSRPRQRQQILIDRDTVLKINRRPPYHHHRKRDFSWPPPPLPDDKSRLRCSSEEIHFDDSICKRHEIFHLKEMFDRGAVDDNKENISRTFTQQNIRVQNQSHDDNIINSQNVKYNTKEKMNFYDHIEYNNSYNIQKSHHIWPPKYTSNNIQEPIIVNRTYYLPENELHNIGIVEPKLRYFERAASSSPDRHRYHHEYYDFKSPSSLKRWKSNESVEKTISQEMNIASRQSRQSKYEKFFKNDSSNNNDSFLERYKSNSFNELPPLKPKREYHKNMHSTESKLNLNNSTMGQTAIDKAISQQDNNKNVRNFDENLRKNPNIYETVCKDCSLNFKKFSSLQIPLYTELENNNKIQLTNQQIDNYEINNKNKLNTPAIKNFNDKTNFIYEEIETNTISTKNNTNQIVNNFKNYRCCCRCGKITHEYKILPQSTFTVVNYDLAADTKYDAKNICSHNLSVKINENVNNISKNNCVYVDHHHHHHHHQNYNIQNNKNDILTMIEKQNINDDAMKNILETRRIMIECSPEIKQNECKQKPNTIMGIQVTSVANIPSTTVTTVIAMTTDTKTKTKTTLSTTAMTTSIPSVIITTGYRGNVETDLKEKSTDVSINVCEKDALTYQSVMVPDTTIIKENNDDGNQGNQKPKRDENLQATFGKQENITSNITRRQGEISKDTKQNEKIYGQEIIGLSKEDKKKWRRGIYFTDGEYLWGPYEKWPFEEEPPDILKKRIEEASSENENDKRPIETKKDYNNQEKLSKSILSSLNNNAMYKSDLDSKIHELPNITAETDEGQTQKQLKDYEIVQSSLELKNLISDVDEDSNTEDFEAQRIQTEESIIESLRRIDEYMETAEQALNDAERQFSESCTANNILVFDTPLQAVIKDIFNKRLSPISSEKIPPIPPIRQTISYLSPKVSIVENAPVVEQVLLDLYNISMAFDTINNLTNISTAAGISGYTIPYLEDNNSTTSRTEARIIELPVVCADNNVDENIGRDEASLSTTISPYSVYEESVEDTSGTECHSSSSPIAIKKEEELATTIETSTHIDKIIQSKNILSGFLITKQYQEEAFAKAGVTLFEHPSTVIDFNDEDKSATSQCITTFSNGNSTVIVDLANGKTFQSSKEMTTSNDPLNIDKRAEETKIYDIVTTNFNDNKFSQNDTILTSHTHDNGYDGNNDRRDGNSRNGDGGDYNNDDGDNHNDDFNKQIHEIVHEVAKSKTDSQLHFAYDGQTTKYAKLTSSHSSYDDNNDGKSKFCDDTMNKDDKLIVKQKDDYVGGHPSSYSVSYPNEKYQADNNNNDNVKVKDDLMSDINKEIKLTYDHSKGKQLNFEKTVHFNDELNQSSQSDKSQCHHRSIQRNGNNKFRSISQPPVRTSSQQLKCDIERLKDNYYVQDDDDDNDHNCCRSSLIRQYSFDSSERRYYASPSLYMCGNFEPAEGYRKVAWPPVSDGAPIKASTPQPQQPPHQGGHYYQPQQQTHPNYSQQQGVNLSQSQQQYHQQQQSYHQQQSVPSGTYYHQNSQAYPQQESYPQQTQNPQQYYQQQHQRAYSNPPPSKTVTFCGIIPVRERQSPAPPSRRQYSPAPQQQQSVPSGTYYHQDSKTHPQQVSYPQQTQYPQQHYQQQYQRGSSNPPPSSTVSFCGGIPIRERQSPAPPTQTQYTPVSHQLPPLQVSQPFSHSSQGQPSPMSPQPKRWSHVRGPTPTHISYSQGPQYHQSAAPEYPYGSGYNSQFGAGQQNQYYHQPSQQPQSNQQPYHPSVVSHHPPGQQQLQQQQYYQPQFQPQYNQPEPQYYHPQAQQQYQPSADRGQSPGVIQLRREAPISQRPAPVVQSQPAAARFRGGANMRGDLKWPPPEVKAQMAAEEEERIKLARSPAFRPRRVNKDYSQFFAKHTLNSTYPGYKVPPGTQHVYVEF